MSTSTEALNFEAPDLGRRALWIRQVGAILRLEVRKNFISKRAILLYLLAASPVLLMAALSVELGSHASNPNNVGEANVIFANLYEDDPANEVSFGCAGPHESISREVVDRSLHYYFLAPVRREVLVFGKYFSGVVATLVLFTITTAGSLMFLYVGLRSEMEYLTNGPGKGQALTYLGITWLACIGYGAVFLVIGLFFRNPMLPSLLAYGGFINFCCLRCVRRSA